MPLIVATSGFLAVLDHRTINKVCEALNCQPNDIMEYVPDEEETSSEN